MTTDRIKTLSNIILRTMKSLIVFDFMHVHFSYEEQDHTFSILILLLLRPVPGPKLLVSFENWGIFTILLICSFFIKKWINSIIIRLNINYVKGLTFN